MAKGTLLSSEPQGQPCDHTRAPGSWGPVCSVSRCTRCLVMPATAAHRDISSSDCKSAHSDGQCTVKVSIQWKSACSAGQHTGKVSMQWCRHTASAGQGYFHCALILSSLLQLRERRLVPELLEVGQVLSARLHRHVCSDSEPTHVLPFRPVLLPPFFRLNHLCGSAVRTENWSLLSLKDGISEPPAASPYLSLPLGHSAASSKAAAAQVTLVT